MVKIANRSFYILSTMQLSVEVTLSFESHQKVDLNLHEAPNALPRFLWAPGANRDSLPWLNTLSLPCHPALTVFCSLLRQPDEELNLPSLFGSPHSPSLQGQGGRRGFLLKHRLEIEC